jgi:hypothetical protein
MAVAYGVSYAAVNSYYIYYDLSAAAQRKALNADIKKMHADARRWTTRIGLHLRLDLSCPA